MSVKRGYYAFYYKFKDSEREGERIEYVCMLLCESFNSQYYRGFPIADALDKGADIVITGRTTDSALALGPLIHKAREHNNNFYSFYYYSLVGRELIMTCYHLEGLSCDCHVMVCMYVCVFVV